MTVGEKTARVTQAVLFADISGSVGLYAERGDTVGFELSSRCLQLLGEWVRCHGGRVIKELGDAILAVHADAAAAVRTACDMVAGVRDPDSALGREELRIRVGVAFGPVVHDRSDVFGDTVNVASRLLGLARAEEILLTAAAVDALPPELRARARPIDRLALRGRPEPVMVYRYSWRLEEETDQTAAGGDTAAVGSFGDLRMEVECASWKGVVDREHPRLRIGRGADNDLILDHDKVSRVHAEIRLRNHRFFLADRSTNGTLLHPDNALTVRVHREEVALLGSGCIVLGSRSGPRIGYRIVAGAGEGSQNTL